MWCLSRFLPMIIHDLVPEDNPDWELFSDLMKMWIYSYLTSYCKADNLLPASSHQRVSGGIQESLSKHQTDSQATFHGSLSCSN